MSSSHRDDAGDARTACHTLVCATPGRQAHRRQVHANGGGFEARAEAGWSGDAEVAACMVRIKEIQGITKLEERRLLEQGSTERCRIVEEQRSLRLERLACAQESSAAEHARTTLAVAASRDRLQHEALAARLRLEEQRLQLGLDSGWVGWLTSAALGTLTLAGLAGLLAPPRQHVLSRRSARQFCALLVAVCSILQLCRHASSGPSGARTLQSVGGAHPPEKPQAPPVDTASDSGPTEELKNTRASCPSLPLPALDPDAAAGLGGSAGSTSSNALAQSQGNTLRDGLAASGLEMYSEALAERGYDAEVICMLSTSEAEEMFEAIDCKPGHRVRFRRLLYSMQSAASDGRGIW
mmetsp:Transcript_42447/g.79702  ORF Transcript_42447/g.79702 Transcript_42447/m.79702 type:complete len:353 (-) Transcript_42447:95-1153(-)